ncbi:unnamed protein product [Schistosoma mattheei]|uniref:Uncharacterized protein n=1 Tax=Schistosoma mattheei TaxID=31246 RepID=A0A3P8HQC9_9TREM|nr:unnamed protein product [Schistosoma mattheei]
MNHLGLASFPNEKILYTRRMIVGHLRCLGIVHWQTVHQ